MPTIAAIGDAVASELSTKLTADGFATASVARAYVHSFDPTDDLLHVTVAPTSKTTEKIAKAIREQTCELVITITKRVADATNTTVDALMAEVERLFDFFDDQHALATQTTVKVMGVAMGGAGVVDVYDEDKLWTGNLFWSQLTLTLTFWGA